MKRTWRALPLALVLVASSAAGTSSAATGDQAPRGASNANDGTYDVTVTASTCSDGLAKTLANSVKLIVKGTTVTITSATGSGAKTGEVSNDGSFTISNTLSDGGTSTVSGTFKDGQVQGSYTTAFATGVTCTPTFSGTRVGGKKKPDLADEIADEVGLGPAFEAYDEYCEGASFEDTKLCFETIEIPAAGFSQVFVDTFCPGEPASCDFKGFSPYQRTLPQLVHRAQILANAGDRFPSVHAAMPIILKMAFHGATDDDPESARKYATAAWRLLAVVATADVVGAT